MSISMIKRIGVLPTLIPIPDNGCLVLFNCDTGASLSAVNTAVNIISAST